MTKQNLSSPAANPSKRPAPAGSKQGVLLVDDDAFYRTVLKDILSRAGYNVVGEAKDGIEGLNKARALKPGIIILDITMPGKNGLDTAMELSNEHVAVHIIMCTSLKDESFIREAASYGVSAYIIKPFTENDILKTLHGLSPLT